MWKRIDNIRKLKSIGGTNPNFYVEKRVYGVDGKLWPRLTISIYKPSYQNGFKISADLKENNKAWWEQTSIPFELKSELLDMVSNFVNLER